MKEKNYMNYEDLADLMIENAEEGKMSYAVLMYNDAKELLKELAIYDKTQFEFVTLTDSEYDGYNKEFFVIVDRYFNICVEKAWHEANIYNDEGYYGFDANCLYVGEDCDLDVVDSNFSNNYTFDVISFADNDDDFDLDSFNDCDNMSDPLVELSEEQIDAVKDLLHSLIDFALDKV